MDEFMTMAYGVLCIAWLIRAYFEESGALFAVDIVMAAIFGVIFLK